MAALYLILSAAVVLGAALLCVYKIAFHSPDKTQNNIFNIPENEQYNPHRSTMERCIRELKARPFEEVYILSHDGLRLYGRYYHCADGAPLDIAFHGYRGTALRDMCGGIRLSWKANHNVLLVDQRAHGKSQGHSITFGIRERHDCLAWVNYARNRFGADIRIMLYGVSMGAATILMASDMDFGGSVRGIIADSPYSSPSAIIQKVCRDMKLPPRAVYPLIYMAARWIGGFNLMETTATDAVRRSRIPILILHGEDDRFVPQEMSRTIADARADIERHTFPGAGHGISGMVDPERYNFLVLDFIEKCCP